MLLISCCMYNLKVLCSSYLYLQVAKATSLSKKKKKKIITPKIMKIASMKSLGG